MFKRDRAIVEAPTPYQDTLGNLQGNGISTKLRLNFNHGGINIIMAHVLLLSARSD